MLNNPPAPPLLPVLGVSVAVRRDGAVLLIKRGKAPYVGVWAFPGGRVELGERLAEAARREVREEANVEVEIGAQIDTAEIIRRNAGGGIEGHYVLAVFAGRYVSGVIRAGDDAAEARWVAPEELASLNLTEDTARILSSEGWR